jgi:large subunit ribosomal protein L9
MELILLQKVTNLGVLGDKVNVKPGYGRNYLVPQGKAVPATAANVAEFEAKRAEYEAKAKAVHDDAESRAAKLEGASVTITANAATEGKLFGSVGPRDIADAFTAAGLPLEKSEVIMGEGALRNIGEYEIAVKLHADVQTTVKVVVQAEA